MKPLRDFFDVLQSKVSENPKLRRYRPVVNAFDTIFFTPNQTTRNGVHIRDGVDLKRVMIAVVIALIPPLLFGMYNVGYQYFAQLPGLHSPWELFRFGAFRVLPLVIVSYAVGLTVEFTFAVLRGHEVNEGYLVTGMLIPLIVPADLPLWMLAVAVVFAVIIGKEVFGGTGMNVLNPALVARAFLFFAYPTFMSGDIWVADSAATDAISGETLLGKLGLGHVVTDSSMRMFVGLIPGSVGETSVVAILIGAFILIYTGVGSWRIMLSALIGASLMGLICNAIGSHALLSFPWWKHLLLGGFMFGIVFMATDPVSAAQTTKGKWIYGFLVGLMSILIRVFNPAYPEGVMLAILFMNVMAPLIDHIVVASNIKKRGKRYRLVMANS